MSARVAVITPYHQEPIGVLRVCHESVVRQGVAADHFMVADGFARPEIDQWPVRHVKLPVAHGDFGNTPRSIGSVLADAGAYDFIAYLDADNWFHPGHLDSLMRLHERTGAPVCAAWRTFHRPDGSRLDLEGWSERMFHHVDTSCLLLQRAAYPTTAVWHAMPRPLSPAGDRVFVMALHRNRLALAYSRQTTVAYRTQYAAHYADAGEPAPPGAKGVEVLDAVCRYLRSHQGVSESIEKLGFWPLSNPHFSS